MNKSERCITCAKFNLAHESLGQILSGLPSLRRVPPSAPQWSVVRRDELSGFGPHHHQTPLCPLYDESVKEATFIYKPFLYHAFKLSCIHGKYFL